MSSDFELAVIDGLSATDLSVEVIGTDAQDGTSTSLGVATLPLATVTRSFFPTGEEMRVRRADGSETAVVMVRYHFAKDEAALARTSMKKPAGRRSLGALVAGASAFGAGVVGGSGRGNAALSPSAVPEERVSPERATYLEAHGTAPVDARALPRGMWKRAGPIDVIAAPALRAVFEVAVEALAEVVSLVMAGGRSGPSITNPVVVGHNHHGDNGNALLLRGERVVDASGTATEPVTVLVVGHDGGSDTDAAGSALAAGANALALSLAQAHEYAAIGVTAVVVFANGGLGGRGGLVASYSLSAGGGHNGDTLDGALGFFEVHAVDVGQARAAAATPVPIRSASAFDKWIRFLFGDDVDEDGTLLLCACCVGRAWEFVASLFLLVAHSRRGGFFFFFSFTTRWKFTQPPAARR